MAEKELDHSNEIFDSDVDVDRTKEVNLSSEMKNSFLDYSMSVIVSRALPDVRDGLKPVHRRIIYSMNEQGMTNDKPHKKSARIVGDVIGKYHPHGDTAVYDAMVRLAQSFSCRYPIIDGHGNFGSVDGDPAAAMRYTEARMSKIANEMVRDINKNTVDFIPNYDGEEQEPVVLPARIPNILINGSSGIAVGMATNIPPHNLKEVIDATLAVAENPDIDVIDLINNYIHGPDFPTAGIILGKSGIKNAYETGSGLIVVRSRCNIEDDPHHENHKRIVVSEIPYQVNKKMMIERMADLVKNKVIEGIRDLRDESNREGIRVVIELKKEAIPEVVLNQLFKYSQLQVSYSINMLAIIDGQPKIFPLKEVLKEYVNHQINVIRRKTQFDLDKALDRIHILEGLRIARQHLDEIIAIIKASATPEDAQNELIAKFSLSEKQAKAILDMRLHRLTGIEQEKIENEIKELELKIADFRDILENHHRVLQVLKEDLNDIKERYGDDRRTEISNDSSSIEDEELIPVEDVVYTLTGNGYIKRVPVDTYRTQNRGGRGVKGITTHDDDIVEKLLFGSTHTDLLFFSSYGKVYRLRGYQIPEYTRQGKGIPVINLLPIEKEEKIKTMITVDEYKEEDNLVFVTKCGIIKRVSISQFVNINRNGKIAIGLRENDELYDVKKTTGNLEIYIGASTGKVCRFNEQDARQMGRTAAGVRGINITDKDEVIGVTTSDEGKYILVITSKGFGKMSNREDYRLTQRGGKGVLSLNSTERNGTLIAMRAVNGDEDLLVTTSKGIIIRVSLTQVKVAGRNTQGVKIIKLDEKQSVASIAIVDHQEEESEEVEETSSEQTEK
jgi:DNA gyrase subunit A